MSTNKTENYQLHRWEPEDDFLRQEFNENFAKLDRSARMIFGTYQGTAADFSGSQRIELGVRPLAVLTLPSKGVSPNGNNYSYGGIAGQEMPMDKAVLTLDDTGFTVSNAYNWHCLNSEGYNYYYIVLY